MTPALPSPSSSEQQPGPASATASAAFSACLVGHGTVGSLYATIMSSMGADLGLVEPDPARSATELPRWASVESLPADRDFDIWVISTPTEEHLRSLAAIYRRDPQARVLLEKPACRVAELGQLTELLRAHPHSRVAVMDQYRYAAALFELARLRERYAPGEDIRRLRVAFSKDRRPDMARGRFIDRDHGLFGYEWLHMIAVLRHFVSQPDLADYLTGPVRPGSLVTALDADRVATAALERTSIGGTEVELFSTVVGDAADAQVERPIWTRDFPVALGERQRLVRLEMESVNLTVELEPLGSLSSQLGARNRHRITVDTAEATHRTVISDSPLGSAVRHLIAELREGISSAPDLLPLRRIATLVSSTSTSRS
ncbi:Gfo/Idh/MocA family oxidoreductase [Streptomyces sp. NPDC095817]|uniref:Gfo/Idh/MocA family oxidoreductase n=1 Tax=Streptomyces sp. NPDC095817 TaxID=3155082 RepID=UPI0033236098